MLLHAGSSTFPGCSRPRALLSLKLVRRWAAPRAAALCFFTKLLNNPVATFRCCPAVKEAIRAIYVYLLFMLILMLGYAVAFHVLFRKDQKHEVHYCTAQQPSIPPGGRLQTSRS